MSFQRGDVVGGREAIDMADRCYYWRDEIGQWFPFPDGEDDFNEQSILFDDQVAEHLESGVLINWPRERGA